MSNLGHAVGINGGLAQHILYAHRHIYCPPSVQEKTLRQLAAVIAQTNPDICCFVEIDGGSINSANVNQLGLIVNEYYPYHDISNKYGDNSRLRHLPITRGKSNAFIAKQPVEHEKIYFIHGTKRLIYRLRLSEHVTLFFAHFSLHRQTRGMQIKEVQQIIHKTPGEIIVMGDFNVLTGLSEIMPLLEHGRLRLMNRETDPTFTFHRRRLVLDLCFCTQSLADHAELQVVPQPYSDHAALILKVQMP